MLPRRLLSKSVISIVAFTTLAACSVGSPPSLGNASTSAGARHATSSADSIIYVANSAIRDAGNVVELDTKTGKVLKTLYNGVDGPIALAVDPAGNLYVANRIAKNVSVYAPNASLPDKTISQGIVKPSHMLFDPAGDLDVLNVKTVTVYDPSSGALLRTLKNKLNRAVAFTFDPAGDVFVVNYDNKSTSWDIVEYAAGSTKVLRSFPISTRFAGANCLVFGPDGYLYVGEDISIAVYDPTNGSIVRTFKNGVYDTLALAFDSAGNFYIANNGVSNGIISVYGPGSSTPSYEITVDDAYTFAMLFDQQNDLYLASQYGGSNNEGTVAEFLPGKTSPKRVLSNGLAHPDAAVFGP